MIHIGICSWAEKTLIKSGDFYPEEIKTAEDRLRFYAGYFDTVEVDSTYYAIPSMHTVWLWAQRTPDDFIFHIKVYGAMTGHRIDPKTLPKALAKELLQDNKNKSHVYIKDASLLKAVFESFIDAINPLKRAGKLGLLVFQFPPWFHYSTASLDYLLKCRELTHDMRIAVEFRHGSWLIPEKAKTVFNLLTENGITYIVADEPQYGTLATVPLLPEVTTDTAYFRFHGRNRENWLKKGIETTLRHDYLYSEDEIIKELLPAVRDCDRKAKVTYAMFNNCHGGFAVRNALRMRDIVRESI